MHSGCSTILNGQEKVLIDRVINYLLFYAIYFNKIEKYYYIKIKKYLGIAKTF